jgi:putative toxin-antitoxin system antitoxin component (TIGR02293 family)
MLTNYDAGAVAEVMGIGFREYAGSMAAKPVAFVFNIDHGLVRIVEGRAKGASGQPKAASFPLIEKAVELGLPRLALRHVAERIAGGGDKAKISLLEWHIVPKTTLERREEQLSPLESERTERVARLFVHACRALGTEAEAREFMMAPHAQLDGRAPIDAAKTDLGARRAEQILNALEYGLAL